VFESGIAEMSEGAAGGVRSTTETAADPDLPSQVAVIVAVPSDTPVARPELLTVAADSWLEDQVKERPLSTFPLASFAVAVS
jgi:hypothetical protein